MQLERKPGTRAPSLYANAAIFILFFGAALLSAIGTLDWSTALFWVVILWLFLLMTRRPNRPPRL